MRIGFVINDIHTEWPQYTSTRLAMVAAARDHEVFYIGAADFSIGEDDHTYAEALTVPQRRFRSGQVLLRQLQAADATTERICVDDLDVMLLRSNPSDDVIRRPWARLAPIDFGLMAARQGVLVLNDPATLAQSVTKLYLHGFPAEVRPKTLVTRNREEAKQYITDQGGYGVLKPLYGYGGHNVFLVRPEDSPNVNQMFEAVAQDGYVIVQEYLPEAVGGDTRLFLIDGEPLRYRGKLAAVKRTRHTVGDDMRSNLTAGAVADKAEVTDVMLELAAKVGPKLAADGVFLAGLDVVGEKVMEINIMTPGALHHAERTEGVHFSNVVIDALEEKAG